jgi:enoyl-CoA hydratase/carnithine racemase
MTDSDILLSESADGVATLTLNRPLQYNALSDELLDALISKLDVIANDEHIKVVILAANGKAFCAGHDLKEMRKGAEKADHHRLFTKCSAMMQKIPALPQPVIAKVQGMATAAGCQLVATCDMAISSSEARFAVSGIRVGLFCSTPAVALSRNISRKRAMELLMTGEFIDAETAERYGLLNSVVDADHLDQSINELVANIVRHPKRVISLGKKMFYKQLNQELSEAYQGAAETISDNMMLEETLEGIDAFIEKRKPNWS